jgi:hypothetical protein
MIYVRSGNLILNAAYLESWEVTYEELLYSEYTNVIGRGGDFLPNVEKVLLVVNHILQLEKYVFDTTIIDLLK